MLSSKPLLRYKPERAEKASTILAEGPHLLEEALKSSYEVKAVLDERRVKAGG